MESHEVKLISLLIASDLGVKLFYRSGGSSSWSQIHTPAQESGTLKEDPEEGGIAGPAAASSQ